jgi:putative hydrolase of the HAD superfamily
VTPAALDAVTLDAYGTLVELDDPAGRLRQALAEAGVERDVHAVEQAFLAEVEHYSGHKCEGRDAASLAALRRDCARVFVDAVGADLDFTDGFVRAIVFRPLPGVLQALAALRARGLALAVVSNWDCSLGERLRETGIEPDVSVSCAEAGAAKPDPAIFGIALERLGVEPRRTLHVGDTPEDEEGARAAGVHFAAAPLTGVVGGWR